MAKVLIADDEHSICHAFSQFIKLEGHTPLIASCGEEALKITNQESPDAVFLDIQMPGTNGLETLSELHTQFPELPIVIMTAYGTVQTAMEAMRLGAFDYLGKPVELPQIRQILEKALHKPQYQKQATTKTKISPPKATSHEIVGQSAAMQEIFKLMGLLTTNDLTVLLTGESGVGKEVVARGIHNHSKSRNQPIVAVNCAAIPEQLLESELFGYEKGAFTGADTRRIGRFEAAGTGTLFLDEISELPLHLQSKLLRVLQERNFERVGSVQSVQLKARLIAATNKKLEKQVENGQFREDLYHRLKLVTLDIPPLRKRKEDIEALAYHFLNIANSELNKHIEGIESDALNRLLDYNWPGNVRELEHAIKRASLMARGQLLTIHDFDIHTSNEPANNSELNAHEYDQLIKTVRNTLKQIIESPNSSSKIKQDIFHTLVSLTEKELIDEALRITDGNQVAASKLLGLHRTTMRNKLGTK